MKHSLSCLIVDDDPMYAMVASSILSTLTSGPVRTAPNGRAGLAALSGDAPETDLVFLDLNMPDLDGLAFMRGAHEAGYAGNIVISSGESPAVLRSAEAMGKLLGISVLGVLRKPLTLDGVAAMLAKSEETRAPSSTRLGALVGKDFELTPYYQPQYDLATLKVAGFESLIRLTARDGRIHGPSELFSSVSGVEDLTTVSLEIAAKVMRDFQTWPVVRAHADVSINFDASVLEQPSVVSHLQQAVVDLSLDPHIICLEVTEKSLPKDPSRLVEALTRLRMTGFKLSLDDYGMGASSFELLRLCPFSEIKVDRSIIEACPRDNVTRKFLHAVAGLARDLELVSVAEGVENQEELSEVRAAGMDRVQGFLFSRPVPPQAVHELMNRPKACFA
ncbi:EAL domain-containing response regulator [Rhizobium sp. XQZ8]|uniref:EAL domain-containing response regulator n=1 Tax=Rhizobium populisoli TaxID=2859785 RepID=UPI001C681D56|nr:EAL domain-containing response regulator [Rhizobium populisoli]MBW6425615.1 EAL domain-containing response regulator [Rhizobium populisoli]